MWLNSFEQPANPRAVSVSACAKQSVQISLLGGQSARAGELQDFIRRRYAETYFAQVTHFLPLMLASVTEQGIQAVLGLRPGSDGRFFSEQYLDVTIEQAISAAVQQPVERGHIIETGNLASLKGGSQRLFIILTELLYQSGFHWVCFTATPQVEALLHRMGFAPQTLAIADPVRLSDAGHSWGSYYHNHPNVLVGDVSKARATLIRNEIAVRILQEHTSELADAVTVLKIRDESEGENRG